MTAVHLSRVHFPVTTLGPGRRIGVWFQGCSIRCPGCISLDTWAPGKHETTIVDLSQALAAHLPDADGLTVSGGEPFDQPAALRALLEHWRARHAGDVLVYSGYPLERLQPLLVGFSGLIDALITDPFVEAAGDRLALRGSDNQRLFPLTPLGERVFALFASAADDGTPRLDIMFDDDRGEVFLAGIPRRGDLARLQAVMAAAGHVVVVTEDRRK